MPKAPDSRPEGYEAKSSRRAIHWLAEEVLEFVGHRASTPTYVVACAQPLDEVGHRTRTTKVTDNVTCWACVQLMRGKGLMPWGRS